MKIDSVALFDSLDGPSRGSFWLAVGSALTALETLYAFGLEIYLLLEMIGLRRRFAAPVATVSVGNLSVGGTGKTPAVIALALAFKRLGYRTAVLSRGHGGSSSKHGAVVSNDLGKILLSVEQSGDEPMVLAKSLPGIPVLVGKDRRRTAKLAIQLFAPDILILDDGFQYWQLRRDLDIVLLDSQKPFENGHCLPRGLLREPLHHLSRARMGIVTRSSSLDEHGRQTIRRQVSSVAPELTLFFAEHQTGQIVPWNDAARELGSGNALVAVCAIAKPVSFLSTLSSNGISPNGVLTFPDHHRYDKADVRTIKALLKSKAAQAVITTEKDAVKLSELLPDVALFVQTVTFSVLEPSQYLAQIMTRIGLPTTGIAGVN